MKKVSVYIPCYNSERTIAHCIESAMAQTWQPGEIIVIDDHSCDGSVGIIKRYPVKLIVHGKNLGLAACRNRAFESASGELVAALDADCVACPDWLEKLIPFFDDDGIAGAGGRLIEDAAVSLADKWRSLHMAQEWGDRILNDPPFLYGCNTVFRKASFLQAGPYDEALRNNYEDVDFSERLYARGSSLVYEPSALVRHLKSEGALALLRNYRRWRQAVCDYGRLKRSREKTGLRTVILRIGELSDRADFFQNVFWNDLHNKEYRFLGLDILFLAYSLFQDTASVAREVFRTAGGG